jgi:ubiquinone/menaquinone biosynthesis C-methylase UbiE
MNTGANTNFEEKYIALRKKENRLYTDEEVAQLPEIAVQHPHYKEWMVRKQSMKRLMLWIEKKNRSLKILEVGCGNGWVSNQLSQIANTEVTGLDINPTELQQAKRIFKNNARLKFIAGEINSPILAAEKFDVILFAASIQYFPSLKQILNNALQHLNETGEIHIIDTNFYKTEELAAAKKRSDNYFMEIGFPEMTKYYFHHSIEELQSYNYKVLYDPYALLNKLSKNRNPFPWICIKRN